MQFNCAYPVGSGVSWLRIFCLHSLLFFFSFYQRSVKSFCVTFYSIFMVLLCFSFVPSHVCVCIAHTHTLTITTHLWQLRFYRPSCKRCYQCYTCSFCMFAPLTQVKTMHFTEIPTSLYQNRPTSYSSFLD